MKKLGTVGLFIALLLGLTPGAQSSGFLIYEHGAAAMAMAGAFVSVADDPSTVFHNPAGLAWLEGTQVSLGGTFIIPKGSLALPDWPVPAYRNIKQLDQTFLAPNFYLTHKFNSKLAAGIGVFAPYGLGTKWPKDYPLKYIATSNEMQTIFINPALSYRINENTSVGVGLSYVRSSLSLNLVRLIEIGSFWAGDVPASLDGASGSAISVNAGALYKTSKFSFGLAWRSGFNIKYEGTLELNTSNVPALFKGYVPQNGDVATTFKFPDIFTAGVSFNLTESLLLSADVQYFTWKRYDKYVINITYPAGFPPADPETVVEDWKNTFIFRGGVRYQLNEKIALKAGLLYDQTPQPAESMDPNLPDANRLALTAGFGYKIGRLVIDVAYQHEHFAKRKSPNRRIYENPVLRYNIGEGTYKTTAHLIGLSLGYNF